MKLRHLGAAVLFLGGITFQAPLYAAVGDLDPAFGSGGISRVPASLTNSMKVVATARQPDGKILVAAEVRASEAWQPYLAATVKRVFVGRFNADGTLDASFAVDGWAAIDVKDWNYEGGDTNALAIAAASGGKVLAVISSVYQRLGIVRLGADGKLDPDFNLGQIASPDYGAIARIAEQPDGQVVVAVTSADDSVSKVFRLDSRGNLDYYGFGQSGFVSFPFPTRGRIQALRLRPDGTIFIGGWSGYSYSSDFFITKLVSTGAFDTRFGVGGTVTADFAHGQDEVSVLLEDEQSRLVAAGRSAIYWYSDAYAAFGILRLDAVSGALDPTFGEQGIVQLDTMAGSKAQVTDLQSTSDGGLLLAGYAGNEQPSDPSVSLLARLDASGQRVTAFGVNGVLTSARPNDYSATGDAFAGALVGGGVITAIGTRRVIAGVASGTPPVRGFVLRQHLAEATGAPMNDAWMGQAINGTAAIVSKAITMPDGRTLAVGTIGDAAHVMRLRAIGSLDTDFQDGGRFVFRSTAGRTAGRAIAVDANGNIIVASTVTGPPPDEAKRWSITRWSSDGFADSAFAGGEALLGSFVTDSDIGALAVQGDGKILVAGTDGWFSTVVARLNPDGSLDPSFNGGISVATGRPAEHVTAMSIRPDGSVLVAANSALNHRLEAVVLRLTPDGIQDSSWGANGFAPVIPRDMDGVNINALAQQQDGRIVVGGACFSSWRWNNEPRACVIVLDEFGDANYTIADAAGVGPSLLNGIATTRDGKLVAAGETSAGYPFVMRLNRDRSLDATYGAGGLAQTTSVQSGDWIANVLDLDGKVRVLGYTLPASGREEVLLAQFLGQDFYTEPDPIQFADVTGVPVSQLVVSAPATISGINVPIPISAQYGEYSIGCNGAFTNSAGTISNGQTVCVRVLSANDGNGWSQMLLTVGSIQAWFNVQTGMVPETSITASPPNIAATTNATFAFTSNEAGATFRCSLDAAPFAACLSPLSYSALAEGDHRFQVQAVNGIGPDRSPAEKAWRIDVTPPETTITQTPPENDNSHTDSATFVFSSSETGGTFECSLDAAPFTPCASPLTYTALAKDKHTFAVRARDAAGNVDASPATYAWKSH